MRERHNLQQGRIRPHSMSAPHLGELFSSPLRARCQALLERAEAFPYSYAPLEAAIHTIRPLYGQYLNTLESAQDRLCLLGEEGETSSQGRVGSKDYKIGQELEQLLAAPSTTSYASSAHVAAKQPQYLYDTGILEGEVVTFLDKMLGEIRAIVDTCEQQHMFSYALFKRLKHVYDEGMTFKERLEQDSTPQESMDLYGAWSKLGMAEEEEEEGVEGVEEVDVHMSTPEMIIIEGEEEEIIIEEEEM